MGWLDSTIKAVDAYYNPEKETPMTDNPDIHILSKSYYRALADYPCSWADDGHSIKKGRRYVRVVAKPEGGEFQTQKVCLDCWVKP
jgi:hypothetical protein